ncbi:MAG: 4-hydroxythreonine-4-phosphate dehydrogenase PdxA [Wenzhouxiangellaceae bacterium]|nr:4-hydroxythreonine-4-phosphate dehydrogenase PdxA [Wenzhouxiangellaceae bacterium]
MKRPLVLTPGEPAGIGPELAVRVARGDPTLRLVADPGLLLDTAQRLGLDIELHCDDSSQPPEPGPAVVCCLPVPLARAVVPGQPDPANADYVLETLKRAVAEVQAGRAAALVTGPVHKGVINRAGIAFSGHTEFLAERAGVERVVMLLVAGSLRVALATTHLPLRSVADAIQPDLLIATIRILAGDLQRRFAIARPRIAVLGLNPHAGEDGVLGREELDIIIPVLKNLSVEGLDLVGPLPADSAFVPERLAGFDAVLAMYHDQGLPVLKHAGFGHAVNVTLGLPFVRTSVDHGTALDIAGHNRADPGSLRSAIALARDLTDRDRT